MRKYLSALMILIAAPAFCAPTATLNVTNVRPPGGTLYIAIYAGISGGSWQDEPVLRLQNTVSGTPDSIIELELPDGHYAARAFLDRNQNGQMDTNRSGKPLEPFAISVGEHRKKPSLKFSESIFIISPEKRQSQLILRYPKSSTKTPPSESP